MLMQFHDLLPGDRFSFEEGGPVFVLEQDEVIDHQGSRLFTYKTPDDGLHAHLADHTPVWSI